MRQARENGFDRLGVGKHKIGCGGDVVDRRMRQAAGGSTASLISATMLSSCGMERRLAVGRAIDLDLGQGITLEALDQDEVDRRKHLHELGKRRLRRAAQFAHQRQPVGGRDQHFIGAGGAMSVGILARLVDIEAVMGVLDRRDAKPRRFSSGMSRTMSVVLPAPLHPAKPIARMAESLPRCTSTLFI